MNKMIRDRMNVEVEYISIVEAESLKEIEIVEGKILVMVAVTIGSTRLIDNIIIEG